MPPLATLILVAIGTVVPNAAAAILNLPIHINNGYVSFIIFQTVHVTQDAMV